MELTKNEILSIISTGTAEQSPIADEYIREAREQYGVEIVACYVETHQILRFPEKRVTHKKLFQRRRTETIDPKDAYLVNYLHLTVYQRGRGQTDDALTKEFGGELLSLFEKTITSRGIDMEYVRFLSPDEMRYYGWTNKKSSECDMNKLICPEKPAVEQKEVSVESFDDLALWTYLSRGVKSFNSFQAAEDLAAKVYYGWDSDLNRPTLYIILPGQRVPNTDEDKRKRLNSEILKYLHSKDKFGVVHDNEFSPIYTVWSALPEKLRFSLLRG